VVTGPRKQFPMLLKLGMHLAKWNWTKKTISNVAKTWYAPRKVEQKGKLEKEKLHLTEILPTIYKPVDIVKVVQKQTHFLPREQEPLHNVLMRFQSLFQGKHAECKGEHITLELLPDSKPFYAKPFSILTAYQQITRDEISQFKSIGILAKIPSSEWAALTLIITKKNKTGCIVANFLGLNKCFKRTPYPIPKIPNMFKGMEKLRYTKTIDLSMGYYSIQLSSQKKTATTLPSLLTANGYAGTQDPPE
jgi:hypothetical protein